MYHHDKLVNLVLWLGGASFDRVGCHPGYYLLLSIGNSWIVTMRLPLWAQEASDTAHEAAEAVLKPQTSESYYSEEPSSEAAVQPDKGSSVAAHPAGDEDQFLSLANGEAQADAPDVGKGPPPGSGAHSALTFQPQRGPAATDPPAASDQCSGALHEAAEEEAQPVSEHAGVNEGEQDAPGAVVDTPAVEPAADQDPSLQHLG